MCLFSLARQPRAMHSMQNKNKRQCEARTVQARATQNPYTVLKKRKSNKNKKYRMRVFYFFCVFYIRAPKRSKKRLAHEEKRKRKPKMRFYATFCYFFTSFFLAFSISYRSSSLNPLEGSFSTLLRTNANCIISWSYSSGLI